MLVWNPSFGAQDILLLLTVISASTLSYMLYRLENQRSKQEDYRFWYEKRHTHYILTQNITASMRIQARISPSDVLNYLNISTILKCCYDIKSPQLKSLTQLMACLETFTQSCAIIDSYEAMLFLNNKLKLDDFIKTPNQFKEKIVTLKTETQYIYGLITDIKYEDYQVSLKTMNNISTWINENGEQISSTLLAPLIEGAR